MVTVTSHHYQSLVLTNKQQYRCSKPSAVYSCMKQLVLHTDVLAASIAASLLIIKVAGYE